MKYFFTILSLLLFATGFCQVTKITYGVEWVIDEDITINKQRLEKDRQINNVLESINVYLIYNGTESKFYTTEVMDSDDGLVKDALNTTGAKNPVYCHDKYRYEYGADDLGKDNPYLVKEEMATAWKLHKDTLMVNGYKCFKATYTYSNSTEIPFTAIAWYCPGIPGNFGPAGTGNLPGAILIYQYAGRIYKARSIQFNVNEKIDFPEGLEAITMQQYEKLLDDWEIREFGEVITH